MLRGYRGIFAAIAGLALAGAAPPGEPSKAQNSGKNNGAPPSAGLNYAPYPDIKSGDCYQSKDHDSADLCAQWRAALAAEEAAKLGWWGNLIGILAAAVSTASVVLVVIALRQTEKSLRAAREANEIAAKAQRPWISIQVIPKVLERKGGALRFEADIVATNKGQMAAKNFGLGFKLEYVSEIDHERFWDTFKQFDKLKVKSRKVLLPGDTETFRFWSYYAHSEVKWGLPNAWGEGKIGALFIISALYQSDVTEDEWLRTDKGLLVPYRKDGNISTAIPKGLRRIAPANLLMEPYTVGTLGE